jgi:hypothetical protein
MKRTRSYALVEHDGGGSLGRMNLGPLSIYIQVTRPIMFESLHEKLQNYSGTFQMRARLQGLDLAFWGRRTRVRHARSKGIRRKFNRENQIHEVYYQFMLTACWGIKICRNSNSVLVAVEISNWPSSQASQRLIIRIPRIICWRSATHDQY